MPFKSEKQRKWMWVNDPEMAKKWEKKEKKMKREQKVRKIIRKMVREIMQEDFAGTYPKSVRKKFDNKRRKQSEVLGYKLVGKDDIKVEIDDATIKEGTYKFSKDEMAKLHKDGQLEKDGNVYIYTEDSLGDRFQKNIERYQDKVRKEKEAYRRAKELQKKKNEGKLKEAKESIFDVAARVLKNKQYEKYKGVRIDLQTANLLSTVHSKVNNKMRSILTKLGDQNIKQLINTLWAIAR